MYYFDLSKHTKRVVSVAGLGGYIVRRSPDNGRKKTNMYNIRKFGPYL